MERQPRAVAGQISRDILLRHLDIQQALQCFASFPDEDFIFRAFQRTEHPLQETIPERGLTAGLLDSLPLLRYSPNR
jgi:hypothetical protein